MMMKRLICICICLAAAFPVAMQAKTKKEGRKAVTEQPAPKPVSDYEKLFKGKKCRTEKGLITLHDVEGSLLVEFPLSLTGRDVLIGSTISGLTDNRFMSVGEKPRAPMQVTFELDGKKLSMCKRRFDLMAEGTDMEEALRRNTLLGILSNFDIKAYSPDSTAVVIDMTDFFTGNTSELNPFPVRSAAGSVKVSQSFRKELSKLLDIRAFDDNVSIKSRLAYSVSMSNTAKRINYLTDSPFTVEVTRSIMLLPETPARVRYADPRIGVFFQPKSKYASSREGVETVYYARRWRLEPSDSAAYAAGELVEPVKPIIFHIDDAFPEFWLPYVIKGVEVWNQAFEKIGFKNVIQARPFPTDDPSFDPDNLKYNCVRYSPSETTNSAGPHWTDPRTGEIINASVYIYHNVVKLLQEWLFVQTAAADPRVRGMKIPQELMGECIAYVVSHEVGHCLGLMHNMAGSSSIPVDSLRSPEFTQKYGTTHSIMDYARFNYVAQPGDKEKGVNLMPPVLGKYDFYAIEWLYRPLLSAQTAEDEMPMLRKFITDHSGDPVYRYGKQQLKAKIDPSAFDEDLGDDPVKAAEYGLANLKYIASNFNDWLAAEDVDYAYRQTLLKQLVAQYQRYLNRVLCNIGGIYMNERFEGDALQSYSIVPAQEQRASVAYLLEKTKDMSWIDECSVEKGWPLSTPMSHNMGVALFRALIRSCGNLWYSAPLMGNESYGQADLLKDVSDFVWKPTRAGKSLDLLEMELQNQYVSWLTSSSSISAQGQPGKPGHVQFAQEDDETMYMGFGSFNGMQGAVPAMKHLCFGRLKESLFVLQKMASTGDEQTRQHYQLLIFKISKALEI